MAKLVEVCESLGYEDVWTHANSGNVVFDAAGSRPSENVAMSTSVVSPVDNEEYCVS